MRRLARQEGSALISAVILMTVILGLGMGLLLFTDNQQKASAREQWSEQAFNVAEAALNAQVGQLSRVWPTVKNAGTVAVTRCTEGASNGTNYCPPTIPLGTGYGKLSHITCPAGTPTEAWGSPITNQWTTYVRSAKPSTSYFNAQTEEGELDYAPPEEESKGIANKLWVRAVGAVNCHLVSLVTLVSRQEVSVPFPKDVLGGNWFKVSNKGGHGGEPIIKNEYNGQHGEIGMRCGGKTAAECEEFVNGGKGHGTEQIEPYVKGPPTPSPLLSEEQLASVRSLAESKGTLMSKALGNCPSSTTTMEALSGSPAYIEGCGSLQVSGNGTANSATNPGFLVMAEGTLTFKGNGTFYGVIYSRNPTNSSEPMVIVGGGTTIEGAIEVDGNGGIKLGSNSVNLIYNPEAVVNLKGSAGATPTRNTFRVLPVTQ
jgi:Tfp pilus assembly protein PilX